MVFRTARKQSAMIRGHPGLFWKVIYMSISFSLLKYVRRDRKTWNIKGDMK